MQGKCPVCWAFPGPDGAAVMKEIAVGIFYSLQDSSRGAGTQVQSSVLSLSRSHCFRILL